MLHIRILYIKGVCGCHVREAISALLGCCDSRWGGDAGRKHSAAKRKAQTTGNVFLSICSAYVRKNTIPKPPRVCFWLDLAPRNGVGLFAS